MQVLMISGSRNRQGRTARAMEAIDRGVTKGGGTTESIFLVEHDIKRCIQCESDGWGICRREQRCIIEDDFSSIVTRIKSSDVVVFANTVYFHDLTESMRAFLERLRRTKFRPALPPQGAPIPTPTPIPAVGLCLSGGGGGGAPECCVSLERMLQTCGFDVVDMIPLRRQNFEMKLSVLELTGTWLATKPTSGPGSPPR
ncbi:MAG: flavodoxin family protein [Dehalococcoidales bacterium]|nr:flavodoxin family protein [Dehalococcoidales bacterium]